METGSAQNKKLEIDIFNSCRICMKNYNEESEMCNIFGSNSDICDKILYCTGIQFTKDDGLSPLICHDCLQDLSTAHKFKTSCTIAYDTFQKLLKNGIKPEIDDGTEVKIEEWLDGDNWDMDKLDNDDDDRSIKEEPLDDEDVCKKCVKEIKPIKKREPYKKPKGKRRVNKFKFHKLSCVPCGLKFEMRSQHEKHKKDMHSQNEKNWVCEVCGKIYNHRSSLHSHMRTHVPAEYFCDQCDYNTANKYDLQKHIQRHTGEKQFQCQHCPSSYYTSSSLSGHIRSVHDKERRYSCDLCGKRFFNRTKCLIHIDSHNNVKRHECEVCHESFTRRCLWKKHLERHHKIVIPRQRPGRARLQVVTGFKISTKTA